MALHPKLEDQAEKILRDAPGMTQGDKAHTWDLYHDNQTVDSLARKLQPLSIPMSVKQALVNAKRHSLQPESTTPKMDAAVEALHRVGQLDSRVLDTAERHSAVTKHIVDAALKS